APSAEVQATPAAGASGAPSGLLAIAGAGQVSVWAPAVPGASGYRIYWSTAAGVTPANGTRIDAAALPADHTGLANGTAYHYVVTAVSAQGESAPSGEAAAVPMALPPQVISATAADGSATVSWSGVGRAGTTGYNLYWGTAAGVTAASGTKVAGATSPFVHTGLTDGTAYFYVVTTTPPGRASPPSAPATAPPPPPP